MNKDQIHACAKRVVETVAAEFPDMDPGEAIMALFGAALMISHEAGYDYYQLLQGFSGFLEDNAA